MEIEMSLVFNIIIGLISGFIINYFADVLPLSQGLTAPVCSECGKPFTIIGYLFSFSCSKCGKSRPVRWIIVLLATSIISGLITFYPPNPLSFWTALPILILFGIFGVIDIEHHAVLIETAIAGLILFLIYGILISGFLKTILGLLAGLGITLSLYFLGTGVAKIVGKIRGREIEEVAFGFGDVMVGTILGALTGWPSIAGVIVISLFTFTAFSLIYFIFLLILGKYKAFANALPFAPFLILGAVMIFYL
jgi:prepilin signal peptidase PulO-like enzyme (type II secretory pathway)